MRLTKLAAWTDQTQSILKLPRCSMSLDYKTFFLTVFPMRGHDKRARSTRLMEIAANFFVLLPCVSKTFSFVGRGGTL